MFSLQLPDDNEPRPSRSQPSPKPRSPGLTAVKTPMVGQDSDSHDGSSELPPTYEDSESATKSGSTLLVPPNKTRHSRSPSSPSRLEIPGASSSFGPRSVSPTRSPIKDNDEGGFKYKLSSMQHRRQRSVSPAPSPSTALSPQNAPFAIASAVLASTGPLATPSAGNTALPPSSPAQGRSSSSSSRHSPVSPPLSGGPNTSQSPTSPQPEKLSFAAGLGRSLSTSGSTDQWATFHVYRSADVFSSDLQLTGTDKQLVLYYLHAPKMSAYRWAVALRKHGLHGPLISLTKRGAWGTNDVAIHFVAPPPPPQQQEIPTIMVDERRIMEEDDDLVRSEQSGVARTTNMVQSKKKFGAKQYVFKGVDGIEYAWKTATGPGSDLKCVRLLGSGETVAQYKLNVLNVSKIGEIRILNSYAGTEMEELLVATALARYRLSNEKEETHR